MRIQFPTTYIFSPGLCLTILLVATPAVGSLQQGRQPQPLGARPEVWWSPPLRSGAERGTIEEI